MNFSFSRICKRKRILFLYYIITRSSSYSYNTYIYIIQLVQFNGAEGKTYNPENYINIKFRERFPVPPMYIHIILCIGKYDVNLELPEDARKGFYFLFYIRKFIRADGIRFYCTIYTSGAYPF